MLHLTPVRVSRHALARYRQRAGPHNIGRRTVESIIRNRILPQLRSGLRPDSDGNLRVRLPGGLVAVVAASFFGGWDVVTVLGGEEQVAEGRVGLGERASQ